MKLMINRLLPLPGSVYSLCSMAFTVGLSLGTGTKTLDRSEAIIMASFKFLDGPP